MLKHYIYKNLKDCKTPTTAPIIFECDAFNILEADKLLKENTGIDVGAKTPYIITVIEEIV